MFHELDNTEVNTALELSGLSEFIARRGADALCGENGCNLSGGEKQRISIARSLLRKSPVLPPDETVLRRYDQILTMKSDQLIETGTYDELKEKKGYYYSLYTVSQ